MKVKYFRFLQSFLPLDMLKKLWTHNDNDINQNWGKCLDLSKCHHRIICWISLVYPKRMVLFLLLFLLSKMENAGIFGDAKFLRWWEDERTLRQGVLALLKSSHVARSRDDSWCWPSLGDKFGVFPCDCSSLSLHYLKKIFLPSFPHWSLILYFALSCDWLVASLSCKSTEQFLFSFCWLLLTWLHSSTSSPHWTLFSPLPLFNDYFLAFSDQDGRGEVLLSWKREETNLNQCLTSTFLQHQRGPHCSPLTRKKQLQNQSHWEPALGTTALPGTLEWNQILYFSALVSDWQCLNGHFQDTIPSSQIASPQNHRMGVGWKGP